MIRKNVVILFIVVCIALSIAAAKKYYKIDQKACTSCAACVQVCKDSAIVVTKVKKVETYVIDPEKCTACGECEKVCPAVAITLVDPEKAENATKKKKGK